MVSTSARDGLQNLSRDFVLCPAPDWRAARSPRSEREGRARARKI